jgi:1-acyl-sn-glycerol-3-phosphate acyltransferase
VFSNLIRLLKVFLLTASYASRIKKLKKKEPENLKKRIDQLKMEWALASLKNLGVEFDVLGAPVAWQPMLFVGNHISYLDIPLVMAVAPVSFVAKEELSRWPIIGEACRSVGTVFVKRESVESRKNAVEKIGAACLKAQQSICLFPSGTTTLTEEKPWKKGVFEVAKIKSLKVQPFRINYSPLEVVAFVGEDALVPHLWRLLNTQRVKAQIEFHEAVEINDSEVACLDWQQWSREKLRLKDH